MTILIIIFSIMITIIINSFFEWYVHGKFMHGKWKNKRVQKLMNYLFQDTHKEHHRDYPPQSYKNPDHGPDVHLPLWAGVITVGFMVILGLLVSYFTGRWEIAPCVAMTSALYFWAHNYFHTCFHVPNNRWFETTKFYKAMDKFHEKHHVHKVKWGELVNICVVCPVADFVIKTRFSSLK